MYCRTKQGTLRLYYEGEHLELDSAGRDLPEALAESIRTHINVEVGGAPPKVTPPPAPVKSDDDEREPTGRTGRTRRSRDE